MKRLLTLALLMAVSCSLLAERVDQYKAANVAKTMLPNKEFTLLTGQPFENLYVFNAETGFVIIAADDCVRPVLAYSTDFPFKTENMPENIKSWLSSLNEEIQDAVDRHLVATETIRQEWELLSQGIKPAPKHRSEVAPLIATHWDQYEPYNNLCPGGSLTGCVATAMAQVMKYWDWPYKGVGSYSYVHNVYGTLSANFGNTVFDWDNMVDEMYYNSPAAQQTAVATLMYCCGVSVDMDYSPSGSSAFTDRIGSALYTYFDYNQNDMHWVVASDYNANSWIALLKAELDGRRPILYRGQGDGGGHAFICDGYDTSDYLHFNWGWSGWCDGYYAFGALEPGAGGAGSGAGIYNDDNSAFIGIRPNTPPIAAPHNLSASVSDRTVQLQWSRVSGASRYKVYCDGLVVNTSVTGISYTDVNPLYGHHTYYVKAVNANGVCSLKSNEIAVELTFPGPLASNVTANVQGHNVNLSWTAPPTESDVLMYGDGQPSDTYYGSSTSSGFTWGQCYTPDQLSPYAGMAITSVDVYLPKVTDYTLAIHKEMNNEWEGLYSDFFYNQSPGWCTVVLPEPIPIDYFSNLWIVFYNSNSDYQYIAAYTEGYEGSDNARLFVGDDGCWYAIDRDISWLIKVNAVDDDGYAYSVYRDGQRIASNITQTSYNDTGLSDGFYQYTVRTHYYGNLSDHSAIAPAIVGSVSYAMTNVAVTDLACHGGNDGTVSVDVTGGFMPLTFTLGGQTATVSSGHYTFQNVSAGTYSLKVTDNMGNELASNVTLNEPAGLSTGAISDGTETIGNGAQASTILSIHDATSGQSSFTYRWKQNGTVIANSNVAQYTPVNLQPGTYTFTREVMDACTDWTPSSGTWKVVMRQTAVDENDANRLEIYPNPTSDKVTVRCEHMESIAVVSMTGQQIITLEVNSDEAELDLTNFHPGVYVLMIHTSDGARTITRISKH
ncbi:MAG: C10 family peptidase [Bacteroidales bacterium]|nr:C10 family peptidase [Bacteroidales bacterium]